MLPSVATALLWFSETTNAIGLLVLAALIIYFTVQIYLRGRRNGALEDFILQNQIELTPVFHGTLAIEEHQPGVILRLCKSTDEARCLQFKYRWLQGVGRQAIFDEVVFDRSRSVVRFEKKDKSRTESFSQFAAIRLREVSGGKSILSLWHVELVPNGGRPIPFVTSTLGDRKMTFEHTAPLAKAVSTIMAIPVQVLVAGNVWTPGWPPKTSAVSRS